MMRCYRMLCAQRHNLHNDVSLQIHILLYTARPRRCITRRIHVKRALLHNFSAAAKTPMRSDNTKLARARGFSITSPYRSGLARRTVTITRGKGEETRADYPRAGKRDERRRSRTARATFLAAFSTRSFPRPACRRCGRSRIPRALPAPRGVSRK